MAEPHYCSQLDSLEHLLNDPDQPIGGRLNLEAGFRCLQHIGRANVISRPVGD
jgi:hypothetical protein